MPSVKNGFDKVAGKHRAQGGLCALCGGPMKLIRLPPGFVDDPLAATLDHEPPRSLRKAFGVKVSVVRAVHSGCNATKGGNSIQFLPLACDDPTTYAPRYIALGRQMWVKIHEETA